MLAGAGTDLTVRVDGYAYSLEFLTSYEFRVRARTADGVSPWSELLVVTTPER